MSFYSQHAFKLWDILYQVYIPDELTLDANYIKSRGVHVTGNTSIDSMVSSNLILVQIPIIKILEYFTDGIEVQIPDRKDMIKMHKDIEDYLSEWKNQINGSIHGKGFAEQHRDLILSLEKLSKYIYARAAPKELIDNLYRNKKIGIVNPLKKLEEEKKELTKPDYSGISKLIKNKGSSERF